MGQLILWIEFQTIADFTNALNRNRLREIQTTQLSAKVANVITYNILFTSRWYITPHLIINLCVCKDTTSVRCQQTKQVVFFDGQFDLLTVAGHFSAAQVNLQAGKR